MKRTKAEKGITLIALIITIIVLLILAVVTIQAVQEHGIIGYAKNAQTEYDKKAEEENTALQGYSTYIDEHFGNWKLSENGNEVTRGSLTLNIGDYVAYTPDGDETYPKSKLTEAITGSSSNTADITKEDLKWRVFGVDNHGCLTLISDQKTSQNVYLTNATGYNNGVYVLNDICEKLYSKKSLGIKARSLTIEDVEGGFSSEGIERRDAYNSDSGTQYNHTFSYSTNKQFPILYKEEKGSGTAGTIREGGVGVNDPYYTEEQLTTRESEKATASEDLVCTQTHYYLNKNQKDYKSDKFYEMLFPSSDYYWLASRYVKCFSNFASFGLRAVHYSDLDGYRVFSSDGSSVNRAIGLRPAVSLGADITVIPCTGANSTDNMHTLEKAS